MPVRTGVDACISVNAVATMVWYGKCEFIQRNCHTESNALTMLVTRLDHQQQWHVYSGSFRRHQMTILEIVIAIPHPPPTDSVLACVRS